jgi:hypothetical protein
MFVEQSGSEGSSVHRGGERLFDRRMTKLEAALDRPRR